MMVSLLVLLVLVQLPLLITSHCTDFQYTVQPPTELPCNPFNGNKWKLRTMCTVQILSGSQSFDVHWFQRDKNGVVTDLGKPEFYTSGNNRKEVYYGLNLNDNDFTESMLGTYWCQVIDTSQQPNVYLGISNSFTILRPNEYDNGLSACLHTTTVSISETKCADDPPPPMTSTLLPSPTTLSTLVSIISTPLSSSIATATSLSLLSFIGSSLYLATSSIMDSPQLSSMFTTIIPSSSSTPIIEISSLISTTTTILSISSSHFSLQSTSLVSSSKRQATSDNIALTLITTTSIIQHKTAVVRSISTVTYVTTTQSITHSAIQMIESPSQGEQQPEPQPFLIYILMIVITVSVVVIIVVISLVILLIVLIKKPKLRDLSLAKETSPVNLAKDSDSMYINPIYSAVNVITTSQDSDKNSYQPLITRGLEYANVYTSIKGRNTTTQCEEKKTYVNVNSNMI